MFTWSFNSAVIVSVLSRSTALFHQFVSILLILLVLLTYCNTFTITENRSNSRIVKTKYGNIRGSIVHLPNPNLQPVETFLGIPYASPPIGKLRFMPPVTPAIWSGVRNAHTFGPVCPQRLVDLRNETKILQTITPGRLKILRRMYSMLTNQSEDCLSLNIYAPGSITREVTRLPVMVFIHGESYEWNAGSTYDGSVLASYSNTVVVTINFRLGILGFFPSPGGSARGNFGLMDQVAALHWIQENIREFGGDERNVTVMGYGHGAACINFLMLSPMARGLFHRAIMLSGSALSPWAIASDAIVHAKNVASALGCVEQANINGVLECLRHKSVEEITTVALKVPTHLTAFGPVIDGIVIPNDPQTLMAKASSIFGNYQLLFGVTKVESYDLFSSFDERHGIDISRRDRLLRTLVRNLFNYHLQEILLTIVNEYTDWTRPFFHPISLFDSLVDIFSDALVVAPAIQTGLFHSASPRGTYFYTFNHQTENGDYNPRLGCIQGQDLAYLFGAPLVSGHQLSWFPQNYTRAEVALSEKYIRLITNFARSGNPNINLSDLVAPTSKHSSNGDEFHWPPYESIQQKYVTFGTKLTVQDHYLAHRLSYWFHLLPQLHKPGNTGSEHHFLDVRPIHPGVPFHRPFLLQSHNNPSTYDGIVRYGSLSAPIAFNTYFTPENGMHDANESFLTSHNLSRVGSSSQNLSNHSTVNMSTSDKDVQQQQSALDLSFKNKLEDGNASFSMIVQSGNYSTALSLTIAIGCSLLILNVLVFAGIFYQKDRNRLETKLMRKKSQNSSNNNSKGQNNGNNGTNSNAYSNSVQMYRINSITDDYNQRSIVK